MKRHNGVVEPWATLRLIELDREWNPRPPVPIAMSTTVSPLSTGNVFGEML